MNGANSVLYGYDVNDRLNLTAVGPTGTPGSGSYAYTAGTNRLASTTTASGTRSILYDARGNMASESRPGAVSATTAYDGYARLTSYIRTGAGTLTFTYNGLDDRVAMGLATGTQRFIYDPDGRIWHFGHHGMVWAPAYGSNGLEVGVGGATRLGLGCRIGETFIVTATGALETSPVNPPAIVGAPNKMKHPTRTRTPLLYDTWPLHMLMPVSATAMIAIALPN